MWGSLCHSSIAWLLGYSLLLLSETLPIYSIFVSVYHKQTYQMYIDRCFVRRSSNCVYKTLVWVLGVQWKIFVCEKRQCIHSYGVDKCSRSIPLIFNSDLAVELRVFSACSCRRKSCKIQYCSKGCESTSWESGHMFECKHLLTIVNVSGFSASMSTFSHTCRKFWLTRGDINGWRRKWAITVLEKIVNKIISIVI